MSSDTAGSSQDVGRSVTFFVRPKSQVHLGRIGTEYEFLEMGATLTSHAKVYPTLRQAVRHALPSRPARSHGRLSVSQASDYTGLSPGQIRRLLVSKVVKGEKVRNRWELEWESLLRALRDDSARVRGKT